MDYKHRVSGTAAEVIMEGYPLALLAMLDVLPHCLPKGERVEVIFEQQVAHAAQRERAMICWNDNHNMINGKPIIAKWISTEKSVFTEASDYLCYALYQRDADKTSQKALLTSPILDAQRYRRNHTRKEAVDRWLDQILAARKRPLPKLTDQNRRAIRYAK